jgi:hypothetical protein
MPYTLIHHADGTCSVKNKKTGHYFSKNTTKGKAEAQVRLLHGLEHGNLKTEVDGLAVFSKMAEVLSKRGRRFSYPLDNRKSIYKMREECR